MSARNVRKLYNNMLQICRTFATIVVSLKKIQPGYFKMFEELFQISENVTGFIGGYGNKYTNGIYIYNCRVSKL